MVLLRKMIEDAMAGGAVDVIVLPETFNGTPADMDPDAGPQTRQFVATLARATRTAVVGGSIDLIHEDGRRRNTCFVVDADGHEIGAYHKRALFAGEQGARQPGDNVGVFEVSGLRVGVMICADLWDPTAARALIDRVDVLCVPAETIVPAEGHVTYARQLWYNLALTRAMENGLPVAVSDWSEARHEASAIVDGTKVQRVHYTSGAASITDPSQRPDFEAIQQQLPIKQQGTLIGSVDLDAMQRFRDYRRSVGLIPPA